MRSGGGRRESVLANGLEALIGAILLDSGTEPFVTQEAGDVAPGDRVPVQIFDGLV